METVKLSDKKLSDSFIRAIIYGPAGCGKTTLAGSFPKPALWFDFDNKMEPLFGMEGVEVLSYYLSSPDEASKIWGKFMKDFKEAKSPASLWKTLVFDSLSMMDLVLLTHCVILSGKPGSQKPTLPVYGEQASLYNFLFNEMKAIQGKNVILTAHHEESRDDDDSTGSGILLEVSPLITGKKIKPKLPALFSDVWALERKGGEKDERILHYRPWKKYIANSLSLKGTGEILNPTYEKIIGEIGRGGE